MCNKVWLLVGALCMLGCGLAYSDEGEALSAGKPLYAIGADEKAPSSEIAKLAGIAPFYHIYTNEGDAVEVVANPYLTLEFGTGPATAKMLIEKGVTVVVGRQMPGPKMMDVLNASNVRFVRRVGKVQDVADELKE
jgi:predicted Fe-Mo cluster-binding NifX family protein